MYLVLTQHSILLTMWRAKSIWTAWKTPCMTVVFSVLVLKNPGWQCMRGAMRTHLPTVDLAACSQRCGYLKRGSPECKHSKKTRSFEASDCCWKALRASGAKLYSWTLLIKIPPASMEEKMDFNGLCKECQRTSLLIDYIKDEAFHGPWKSCIISPELSLCYWSSEAFWNTYPLVWS